jgi:RNA polymerase-binding transcription factor DksA
MADEADRAQEETERALARAIAHARARTDEALPFTGVCHWCGEPVEHPRRWCSAECRDEWEAAQRVGKNRTI